MRSTLPPHREFAAQSVEPGEHLVPKTFQPLERTALTIEQYHRNDQSIDSDLATCMEYEADRMVRGAMTDDYREVLAGESKREKTHKTGHTYSLEEFGLEADSIRSELAGLFDRFQWDAEGGEGDAPARDPSSDSNGASPRDA